MMLDFFRRHAMKKQLVLAGALLAATVPAKAQVVLDMSQITCGQYLDAAKDDQAFIASWLSGYFHAEFNNAELNLRAAKHNYDIIKRHCESHKKEMVMTTIKKIID
jgi:acid stress chaperone HdeB